MPKKNYLATTIQDFSGGLSVVDNELNLDPKYAVVLENVGRATDGSMQPRYGYRLTWDGHDGVETTYTGSMTITTILDSTFVVVSLPTAIVANGNHVEFKSNPGLTGDAATQIIDKFGVLSPGTTGGAATTFSFHLRKPASVAQTITGTGTIVIDTHTLSGNIVNSMYFQDFFIVADDIGEIVAVNGADIATRLWHFAQFISQAGATPLTQSAWRKTTYVNGDVNKSALILGNGQDYPVIIDMTATVKCHYLVDPSSGSNAGIPKAALLKTNGTFLTAVASDAAATVRISAKNTNSVFTGNADPDDAIDVDATQVTTAVNPELRALNTIRDRLFVAFENSCMLAQLGIYNSAGGHSPNFTDIITEMGCVSQRTCVSLGNDIFMLDYSGVPSLTISLNSGAFVPSRVSDLIEPLLQKNIARLSENTLVRKAFAVWATKAKQYMLFLPKYDPEAILYCDEDPILILNENKGNAEITINVSNHGLEVGDTVVVSGVTGTIANLSSSDINGSRTLLRIINDNYIVVSTEIATDDTANASGGDSVTIKPISTETIGYVYHYNSGLRIKAWSIYRGLNFSAGFRSLLGEAYFCQGSKVYKFGSPVDPIYTDKQKDYDYRTWSTAHAYVVNDRVNDAGTVYICLVNHTSAGATFAEDRADRPSLWAAYEGEPINWVWELPWADFAKRWIVKTLRYFMPNATGQGRVKIDMFVDQIYRHPLTRELAPVKSMSFTGADIGGYGAGDQTFGGGRRVREELLWHIPVKAKLLKLRLTGAAAEPLRIVGLSFIYQIGSFRR